MLVGTAYALAPIDGKWEATMEGPQGPGKVGLDLKLEQEVLTGTIDFFGFFTGPISNGKINPAGEVSFDMLIQEANITLAFKGKLEGEKLNLTLEGPMGAQPMAFVRAPVVAPAAAPAR